MTKQQSRSIFVKFFKLSNICGFYGSDFKKMWHDGTDLERDEIVQNTFFRVRMLLNIEEKLFSLISKHIKTLKYIHTYIKCIFYIIYIICNCVYMESSSSRYMTGDNFIGPWGTLNFHLPLRGLAKWGFKFSTLFAGDNRVFSISGMEGAPQPPPTHPLPPPNSLNSTFPLKIFFSE